MSFEYPSYFKEELEHSRLWSINDGSWGFYGYDPSLMKQSYSVNKKYASALSYYCGDFQIFKLVYKNYEGVFDKANYSNISFGPYRIPGVTVSFYDVLKKIELVEESEKFIKFAYSDEQFNFVFTLNLIDFEYINNLNIETIELNNLIKQKYITNINSRNEILDESDDGW